MNDSERRDAEAQIAAHLERMRRMRNGEKIKCPLCEDGFWSAVGDPKTTKVFRCDGCQKSLVQTIRH